jgi:hypothetical protein
LKRTSLLSILAVIPTLLLPVAVSGQAVPPAPPPAPHRYEVYAGLAYTSLNQVNQSRYGLIGGKVSVTRDWGKYFGLMASGDYYKPATGSGKPGNPGNPSVYSFMVGPEFHADLYGNLSGQFFMELGGMHTGGENMTPNLSFAGGFGGGMTYRLNDRWAIRATGDRVAASFSLSNNTPQLSYSSHITWNARGTVGVVYRF